MYTRFYEFAEKPFNMTPDPRFLFLTESNQEALASMIYGISERKGFVSITGEVGTGKTTLIHRLLSSLDERIKTVFIYQTHITFEELLKNILLELELSLNGEDRTHLIRQLNEYLIQRLARDENLAIIIDESQNLNREVMEDLRMLSNLETSSSKLLQIVFVGQPELEDKLSSEDLRQLKQRIGIRRQIRPLNREESRQYIDHRLGIVGSSTSKVFTPEAISRVCKYAQGIPRTINVLCDNALLIGYSISRKRIDETIVKEVLNDMGIDRQEKIRSFPGQIELPRWVLNNLGGKRAEEQGRFGLKEEEKPRLLSRRLKPSLSSKIPSSLLVVLLLALSILLGREYWGSAPEKPGPLPVARKAEMLSFGNTAPQAAQREKAAIQQISPPAREKQFRRIIIAENGSSLFSLAKKYYNMANLTIADHILESNSTVTNPHLIIPQQKIILPEITEDSLILESPDGSCKIHLGTFWMPEAAREYRDEPVLRGKEIEVIPRPVSHRETWYRIVAGEFESREEALQAIQALRAKGLLPSLRGE